MKETRMPPASSANLMANSDNTIYRVSVIDNVSALVQMMAWRQTGDKPLSELHDGQVYWRINASLSLNEIKSVTMGWHSLTQ